MGDGGFFVVMRNAYLHGVYGSLEEAQAGVSDIVEASHYDEDDGSRDPDEFHIERWTGFVKHESYTFKMVPTYVLTCNKPGAR